MYIVRIGVVGMVESTFYGYSVDKGIDIIDGDKVLDFLLKINMDAYMMMLNKLCLGVELTPITLKGGNRGILPTVYFSKDRETRYKLYDDCELISEIKDSIESIDSDYKVVFSSDVVDNYLEYIDEVLSGDYRYNFNIGGCRSAYTKYSKVSLVVLRDMETDVIHRVQEYDIIGNKVKCIGLKVKCKRMVDSDDTTYVNIDDIGTRYDILRVLSRL